MKKKLLETVKKSCETCEWYEIYERNGTPLYDDYDKAFCERNAYSEYSHSAKDVERVKKSINFRVQDGCHFCKSGKNGYEGDVYCERYMMNVYCCDICDAYERREVKK